MKGAALSLKGFSCSIIRLQTERHLTFLGDPKANVIAEAREEKGEKVFLKSTLDAWKNEKLRAYLKESNKKCVASHVLIALLIDIIRYLLCCGLSTAVCVLLTALSAYQDGYLVTVVSDCCADYPEAHDLALKRYHGWLMEAVTSIDLEASRSAWLKEIASLEQCRFRLSKL